MFRVNHDVVDAAARRIGRERVLGHIRKDCEPFLEDGNGLCEFCTTKCTAAEYDEAVAYAVKAIEAYESGYKEAYQKGRSDAVAVIQEAVDLRKRY